ncbi:WhiB family transcriptional regulator [Rhodococcoides fascians]|uniref:WhiB family transcriptional regulator n=1 Tax=Rhodococcoides fascians TaxID=1828 RepID=UPI002E75DE71|nr:WhiB family transcriptional regulator [Rhodococcus fascians]
MLSPGARFHERPVNLPAPEAALWDWQLDARCRNASPAAFFGASDFEPYEHEGVAAAKAICMACPVRNQCLAHAITVGEPFGVWGGMTERERRQRKWFTYDD